MLPLNTNTRRANVLVVTLIVLAGVGSVLALTSERLAGTRSLQSLNLARQQASYAAEAIASLVETKLVQSSGDLNNLTKSVIEVDEQGNNPSIAQRWLQQGLDHEGQLTTKGMWVGNSLVFWRIEPVKIYDRTIADTNSDGVINTGDTLSGGFTDNYQANPNEVVTPTTAWTGASLDGMNPGYYHFRIVSHAFYINQKEWSKQGITIDNADPWTKPEQSIVSAQTQRMVQLKLINLFRYVLFYGATGKTGDIELNPGAQLDIRGAVHSNGALYLGGQGTAYLTGNYTNSATSGSGINIGSASQIATITGVDGIFRTRKVGNYWYQASLSPAPAVTEPWNIPLSHALNGTDSVVRLNGVSLVPAGDSRNGLVGHSDYVRDQRNRNASIVNTLANIPQLSGYPFEHQVVVGRGQPLFQAPTGQYTIRPGDFPGAQQLYYTAAANFTPTVANTGFPIYATDLPLFTYNRAGLANDVASNQPLAAGAVNAATYVAFGMNGNPEAPARDDTFLMHAAAGVQVASQIDGGEARGFYLNMSLFGQASSGRTGVTIRERGAQNTQAAWRMLDGAGTVIVGIAARPVRAAYPDDASWVRAMSVYMARNYVVYFGLENNSPADITPAFFGLQPNAMTGQMVASYTLQSQLPAIEQGFMNRREADSYRRMGYMTAAQAANYRTDVLTLNTGRIQEIIRSTTFAALYPATTSTINSRELFNGLIYAHRTPRLSVTTGGVPIHDVRVPLRYHPLAVPQQFNPIGMYNNLFTSGLYPIVGSVRDGRVNAAVNNPYRIGEPSGSDLVPEVWSVFPSPKQVRVVNGATTNWGAVQTSGRLQGLTVVTPNHCYIQGNYNTTPDPMPKADGTVQYPPCGIYADGMTMLTNRWVDGVGTLASTPTGDTTTYNVSLVTNNIPTDFENSFDEGSGGTHNLLRFLETGGRTFNFLGSIVVLNRMRYGRNYLGAALGYYGAPTRRLNFNDDLLTAEGQPPFSPWGIQVTRVLSSVNIVNK